MAKCRLCRAEIKWIETKSGKKMPIDSEIVNVNPNRSGEVTILTFDGRVVRGNVVGDAFEGFQEMGNLSHFATCPARDIS